MQIKILHKDDIDEKLKTRKLYEENFDIGDKDFVDYYYQTIIKRNEVVVMENDNNIISMVHLNPYEYNICGDIKTIHYLVAIATEKVNAVKVSCFHAFNKNAIGIITSMNWIKSLLILFMPF